MTRTALPGSTALLGLSPRVRTSAGLLVLAAVVTAGAPSIRIQPGDTLSELAQEHGTSVAVLRQLNDLPGNGLIYAGDTLRLPGGSGGSARPASTAEQGYTVRAGDTLSGIAQRYGVRVEALRTRNGVGSDGLIRIGQRLAVPGSLEPRAATTGSTASSVAATGVRATPAENRAALSRMDLPSKAQARQMVGDTARRYGVDPSLALAVAHQESGFQQGVVSGVNAIGVMQVLPRTGAVLGEQHGMRLDLLDTQDNITAGVLLLRQLLRSTGSEERTLAGYYQGLGSIARKGVLPQTHDYLRNIAALRNRFRNG